MMSLMTALAESLAQGLRFVASKESRKYLDEVLEITQEIADEQLKLEEYRDDLVMLRLQRRLLVINTAFKGFKPPSESAGG